MIAIKQKNQDKAEKKESEATKPRGLSASCIKIIALICMSIDHFAASLFLRLMYLPNHPFMQKIAEWVNLVETYSYTNSSFIVNIYEGMRNVGRISFPVYCFFIVEGFFKTRNRLKYAGRLAVCAFLSELPFDMAIYGKLVYLWHQNVFFTLFIGLFAIWAIELIWDIKEMRRGGKIAIAICSSLGFMLMAELLFTDYSGFGILTIVVMYVVRKLIEHRIKIWVPLVFVSGTVVLCLLSLGEAWALLVLPFMCFYRGKKGWNAKWFFYLFYPVHLLVLAIVGLCLGIIKWGII